MESAGWYWCHRRCYIPYWNLRCDNNPGKHSHVSYVSEDQVLRSEDGYFWGRLWWDFWGLSLLSQGTKQGWIPPRNMPQGNEPWIWISSSLPTNEMDYNAKTVNVLQIKALHQYDCLRANKSTSAWGLEARVPFLDKEFISTAMAIDPEWKMVFFVETRQKFLGMFLLIPCFLGIVELNCYILCFRLNQKKDGLRNGFLGGPSMMQSVHICQRCQFHLSLCLYIYRSHWVNPLSNLVFVLCSAAYSVQAKRTIQWWSWV